MMGHWPCFLKTTFKEAFLHSLGLSGLKISQLQRSSSDVWRDCSSLHPRVSGRRRPDGMALHNFPDCTTGTMAGLGVPQLPEILLVRYILKGSGDTAVTYFGRKHSLLTLV